MAYNEALDARITETITDWGTTRKKMFGGTCYLLHGNMLCRIYKDFLILRLGEQAGAEALQQRHVATFGITGRLMKGWVMVEQGRAQGAELRRWLNQARDFVEILPKK